MNGIELRRLADKLWGGSPDSVRIMGQIMQFKRGYEVLLWLDRNNIRGSKIQDFFSEAEGSETRGILLGVQDILNRIDKSRAALRVGDLLK